MKVADVADDIGQALVSSFINLDMEAIRSGALLHDILKGKPDHAAAGSRLLSKMGFNGIADIVVGIGYKDAFGEYTGAIYAIVW